ncbi:MAG TPA: tail fiber protein [Candidatus Elarobacter sp.]|jgi:microcystin-dependent protein|nr:tail fiber protein [Candidatus Elarobacter sp.]
MANPYLGEIRLFPFNFAPQGWAMCNGQALPISQNTALFSLIGTYYGGNGTSTFQLPDFRSRLPIHQGQGAGLSAYVIGQYGGSENVTLTTQQMPSHTHLVYADGDASSNNSPSPQDNAMATFATGSNIYATAAGLKKAVTMNPLMIAAAGGTQPHNNIQPFLVITFCIALEGIYPSRS